MGVGLFCSAKRNWKRTKRRSDPLVRCNSVSVIELYHFFFNSPHCDRWCGQLENNGEGHSAKMSQHPPTSIYIDLVEEQVRRAHIGAPRSMHYINLTLCVSLFPRSNHSQHLLIKLVQGSNGCAVCPLSDLQPTKGLETHSYIFQRTT